jgi:hypothetical protein
LTGDRRTQRRHARNQDKRSKEVERYRTVDGAERSAKAGLPPARHEKWQIGQHQEDDQKASEAREPELFQAPPARSDQRDQEAQINDHAGLSGRRDPDRFPHRDVVLAPDLIQGIERQRDTKHREDEQARTDPDPQREFSTSCAARMVH